MGRFLILAILLFVAGSVADNLLTYWLIFIRGDCFEANPFAAPFIYTQPLWMWFLRDFLGLGLIVAVSFAVKCFVLFLAEKTPPPSRGRIARVASKYWIIVLISAVARMLPAIHNMLLAVFGYESPLPIINIITYRHLMGG